jgi:two-component system cell cycle response regulator
VPSCKRIRDGEDWNPVEIYISARSSALFSRGICPDCERRLCGEVTGEAA